MRERRTSRAGEQAGARTHKQMIAFDGRVMIRENFLNLTLTFYLSAFQIATFEYRKNWMWLRNHFIKIQTKLWTTELIQFCKTKIQHSVFTRRTFHMFQCIFNLILQKFCILHSNKNLLGYTYIRYKKIVNNK